MTNTTKKKTNPIYYLLIIILVLALGFILWFSQHQTHSEERENRENDYHTLVEDGTTYNYNSSMVSILLLGLDKTENSVGNGQADALQLLLLDRHNKKLSIIAIPRDVMTSIRMFDISGNDLGWHEEHLNLAYGYASNPRSGCLYTAQAVSKMLYNIPINYYTAFDFASLDKVMELVENSLEVTMPNDSMEDIDASWYEGATITLTPENVELFLRSRDIEVNFSNTTRMERQEAFLVAYFTKIKDLLKKDFDTTAKKVYDVVNDITTNITFEDMQVFMKMVISYDFNADSDFYTLHGENKRGEYHDEFILDHKQTLNLIKDLFYIKEEKKK